MSGQEVKAQPGARSALLLLLGINLFNFIDRYILAAVEPEIRRAFFAADDLNAKAKTGTLATAFLLSYMVSAPIFGYLADRFSRWWIICAGVTVWSLASGATGLAGTFAVLLITRIFVGIGEGAYGPAAPTIIADLYPVQRRGRVMSIFYLAIPVGGALGYAFAGVVAANWDWRWAFYLVVPPGILLAAFCPFMREPQRGESSAPSARRTRSRREDYMTLLKTPSYVLNTLALAAMTFAIGGLAFWTPSYIYEYRGEGNLARVNMIFGALTVLAGLLGTLAGGWAGDKLRARFPGSYFLVSGVGMMIGFPFTVLLLFIPFPWAWGALFVALFFLFFNTGPANTALANVTHPALRATAFAVNIFFIHLLGDAISPPLMGAIADRTNMNVAFLAVSGVMLLSGLIWLAGMKFLPRDTALVEGTAAIQTKP
ncbi:MAG TPA: MFS transporter [Chthoniobacterales bacterium]|nr:MFS transporter [Chthoniobacterales bacterium]